MNFSADEPSTRQIYHWMTQLISPRPIAWVSTRSIDGVANLAPFSFFSGVGSNPPTLAFCPANRADGTFKDTLANILCTGQFVVNLVTDPWVEKMNQTAAELRPDEDEFVMADIAKASCEKVGAPRVANAAASMECELHSSIAIGTGPGGANMVIGRIVWFHIQDDCVCDDGRLDPTTLSTVGRMGGSTYVRTSDRFEIDRPK
ncbi:flavin reductase family protein [Rubripirellula reticaptiva]|uniref:Flavin reductase like domain protein n=1 Tax=Rubripirellula reticaptiva TaxID=2528013 RepID=A0A5C6EE15_9BACT|nr:flavin reductase family protein [Rubripirellula reticaptiva]TWU47078.1 Flavin reductase like domain protein [Rubripirellula reticaptiva]